MKILVCLGLLVVFLHVIKAHSNNPKNWYEEDEEEEDENVGNGLWGDIFGEGQKPNILIKTVIYELEEDGQPMGEIKLKLNKAKAPFTSDDFIDAMKELKDHLETKEEVDVTHLYPQFKHNWSVHNYEKCPEDRNSHKSFWQTMFGKFRKHSNKVKKHDQEEMDDSDAYRMFPWLGEDAKNYGPGTVFLQKKGTLVVAIAGNEKVCGTAVGKVTDSTMPVLQKIVEKAKEKDGTTRQKRGTGFGLWDISLK